jgi:hypothetical protein
VNDRLELARAWLAEGARLKRWSTARLRWRGLTISSIIRPIIAATTKQEPLPLDLLMFQRGQPRAQSCRTLRRLISFEDQGPSTQQDLKWAVITSQHRSFRQAAQALNIRQSTSIDISNSSKTVLAPSCSCAASSRDPMDRPRAGRGVSLWCRKRLCRPLQTASASRVRGRHRCVVASATRGIVCQFPRKLGSCLFEAAFRVRA